MALLSCRVKQPPHCPPPGFLLSKYLILVPLMSAVSAEPETSIWVQVIYTEVIPGSTSRRVGSAAGKGKKPLQRVLMSRLPLWTSGTQLRESLGAENPAWSNKPVTCMRTLRMWEVGRGGMILGRIPVAYSFICSRP